MLKQLQKFGTRIVVGAGLIVASGMASAADVLGSVDFSSVGTQVTSAAAAIAGVYVIIAGAKIALGFIKRA